jgi:hypothetical protein
VGLSLVAKKDLALGQVMSPAPTREATIIKDGILTIFQQESAIFCKLLRCREWDARGKAVASVKWGRDRRAAERDSRQLVLPFDELGEPLSTISTVRSKRSQASECSWIPSSSGVVGLAASSWRHPTMCRRFVEQTRHR